MGLRTHILKRVVYSLVLLYFVITLNFAIFMLMPGDPVARLADTGKLRHPELVQAVIERYGLDQPMHIRYGKYVVNMLTGQFGYSYYTRKPIINEVALRLQNTLILVIPAEIFAIAIGIVLGVVAASKRGKFFDNLSVTVSLISYSLPVFWIAMMLILTFAYRLNWFPSGHTIPDYWSLFPDIYPHNFIENVTTRLWHLILPWSTLVLLGFGSYLLLTRASMLEVITEDYVTTARAKGLKERTVLFKHGLKNASLPIITEIAITFGFMLSGAIITEQVFRYPGLGMWIWTSIDSVDYPALQAIFLLIAICVIIANFFADILYGIVDPRVKYG